MRDDVTSLFHSLNKLLRQKLTLLNSVLSREPEKRYLVKTGSYDKLLGEIQDDGEIFNEVDLLDFEITQLKENICDTCGIQADSFDSLFKDEESECTNNYFSLVKDINIVFNEFSEERDRLIQVMSESGKATQDDWESLKKTIKFSKIIKE